LPERSVIPGIRLRVFERVNDKRSAGGAAS
jgi:hypothetical protein